MIRMCAADGCGQAERLVAGLCPKHYQRKVKYGTAEAPGVEVRSRNPAVCIEVGCLGKPKAKGLCRRHYQRLMKHGDPKTTKQHDTNPYEARRCGSCETDISHMKSNAVYCSRNCKTRDSERRRRVDGRARSRDRQRYQKERAKRIKAAKKYYYRTQPRRLETAKAWRETNRDKRVAQRNNRRARKYENAGYIGVSAIEWRRTLNRASGRCTYCRRPAAKLVMEHIIPLARGGRHAPANVTPVCVSCNSSKSDLFLSEWRHGKLPPVRIRGSLDLRADGSRTILEPDVSTGMLW